MTSPDILAREARRLKDDKSLQEIIERIRKRAMDKLASVNPDDRNEIIAQQVRVKFCSELFSEFEAMINSGQAKKPKTAI